MPSRRTFIANASGAVLAAALPKAAKPGSSAIMGPERTARIPLASEWFFRTDPDAAGKAAKWFEGETPAGTWNRVKVPHTWQVSPGLEDYRGIAWYRCAFDSRLEWAAKTVRIEFEAVFHSATVWVNGHAAGEHLRKGYTAFAFEITSWLRPTGDNSLVVMVDSGFSDDMLPRGRSSDWAHDGGIYRPVWLLVTPSCFIERLQIDSTPDLEKGIATLDIAGEFRNASSGTIKAEIGFHVREQGTGSVVLEETRAAEITLDANTSRVLALPAAILRNPKLWHFDAPNLYVLELTLHAAGETAHLLESTFGVRLIEVKNGAFYLNGERVRLMGVERMAGSNPEFGMAEPESWIVHDHDDLKNLNCVFTRAHWPQDRRVLEYCDRHGILFQSEVPTWGPNTFKDMGRDPLPAIMQNGIEQLTEMVQRDRNHPCIFSWGLCNEIGGQNPPAFEFAKNMYQHAKKLDPRRLCSYASNSLQKTPAKDVSALMDFVEWNEYYETWYRGTLDDLRGNLQEIHDAFPDMPIVISEYGYCACTEDRPEGDGHRIEILRNHTAIAREIDFVAGLIFFDYNDYRTHIGDKGIGAAKQRIHGVVDLYGARKPSYDVLRMESSPVQELTLHGQPNDFSISIVVRNTVPAHALADYRIRGIFYGAGNIPLERVEVDLLKLAAGQHHTARMAFTEKVPTRIVFDVLRPTSCSALTKVWVP